MAVPIWPPSLPNLIPRDSITESVPNEQLRNKMDAGTKVRRKSSIEPDMINLTIHVTDEEWYILRAFAQKTLDGGTIAFDWKHVLSGEWVRAAIVPQSDTELFSRSFDRDSTNRFTVDLTFEVFAYANIV